MSMNADRVPLPLSPQLQDSALPAELPPDTPDVANPSQPEQSGPVLLNRAATHSSTLATDELNQPSTPIVEHSAPEKSDRSSSASSATTIATKDDEITSLKKAAEQGDAQAQFKLGMRYYNGKGVEVNNEKAFLWVHKAAELGYAKAQFCVGRMYVWSESPRVY